MADLERAIDKRTRLLVASLISYIDGFQHDLKRICDIAHANGAFVYADIVQAAAAMPPDVKASGVDFCDTASYKWLMGDFGLGLLYVKRGVLENSCGPPLAIVSSAAFRIICSRTMSRAPRRSNGNNTKQLQGISSRESWLTPSPKRSHFLPIRPNIGHLKHSGVLTVFAGTHAAGNP